MKLECLFVGKTAEKYLEEGIGIYLKRLNHYAPSAISIIPPASTSGNQKAAIQKESESLLKKIGAKDFVVLLDERGKELTSLDLAGFLNKSMVNGTTKIIFIVGGAFGVGEQITGRADLVLSFSKFTLTHQMIRIFLLEQVYRAMTIIRNESYHHS